MYKEDLILNNHAIKPNQTKPTISYIFKTVNKVPFPVYHMAYYHFFSSSKNPAI